ncbi:ubiquitin-like small modifier protein 1 [Natronosalvus halobius]|uniref:ubiquitin-like small modifier protein 1 n=1 Tax=Natronosalvus halobius TaxID=2953746 RepID=UPI00273A612B|nr:ubiquitin-like small modifier protein 1 [Natronosalvus halobius]
MTTSTSTSLEWKLFADLAEHAGDREVSVAAEPGDTVGDALDALLEDRPALAERVLEDGELRSQINLLRNGADVRSQEEGLETELEAGDELALFPPVSGG